MKYNLTPKEILNRIEQIRKIDNLQKDENVKPLTEYEKESLPTIPKGWEWTIINDISEFITNGVHTPTSPIDENGYGLHCLRITDIQNKNIDYKKLPYALRIVETDYGKKLRKGDIYFSFTGNNLGKRFMVHEDRNDTVFAHYFVRWHPILVNPYFVYYVTFSNIYDWFINVNKHGSTQPNLKVKDLKRFPIPLCDLITQEKITKILKSLDDKIALNILINDNLLEMINTLYKENFNDIVVYDKAENIADITIGKTPPRKERECFTANEKDMKWISISDLGKSGIYIFNTSEKLTMDSIKKYNVKVIPKGTIILSFKLTVGKIAITTENMATNEAIAHFNLKNEDFKYYLYSYLKNFDYAKLGSTSSIATAVNSKIIKAMPIGIPNEMTIKNYNKKIQSLFEKILENEKENQVLEQLRDTLLPKLMNGEINLENIKI